MVFTNCETDYGGLKYLVLFVYYFFSEIYFKFGMHNGTKLKIMLKVNFLRGLNLYWRKCKQLDECQIYFFSLFIFSTGKQREHNNDDNNDCPEILVLGSLTCTLIYEIRNVLSPQGLKQPKSHRAVIH